MNLRVSSNRETPNVQVVEKWGKIASVNSFAVKRPVSSADQRGMSPLKISKVRNINARLIYHLFLSYLQLRKIMNPPYSPCTPLPYYYSFNSSGETKKLEISELRQVTSLKGHDPKMSVAENVSKYASENPQIELIIQKFHFFLREGIEVVMDKNVTLKECELTGGTIKFFDGSLKLVGEKAEGYAMEKGAVVEAVAIGTVAYAMGDWTVAVAGSGAVAVAQGTNSTAIAKSCVQLLLPAVAIALGRGSTAEADGKRAFGFAAHSTSEAKGIDRGYVAAVFGAKATGGDTDTSTFLDSNESWSDSFNESMKKSFLTKLATLEDFIPGAYDPRAEVRNACEKILTGSPIAHAPAIEMEVEVSDPAQVEKLAGYNARISVAENIRRYASRNPHIHLTVNRIHFELHGGDEVVMGKNVTLNECELTGGSMKFDDGVLWLVGNNATGYGGDHSVVAARVPGTIAYGMGRGQ